MKMNRLKNILLFLFCTLFLNLSAQQDTIFLSSKPTNVATLFGIGSSNLYDTYLSPLEYKGRSFRLINERMRQTSWFDRKFNKQQTIGLEFAMGDNPAKNASEYWFLLDYTLGGHYSLLNSNNFKVGAGGLWNTSAGVLYNQRNSNNPASVRAYSNILLSAIAMYNWKKLTFRWQLDTPVAGILFSPAYGQSYYEISLGNSIKLANFASLHNQRALRNYLTVDIPINKYSVRLGYLGSYYQTKVNSLQAHAYSHSFMIGLVSESINLSGHKIKESKVKSRFYSDSY